MSMNRHEPFEELISASLHGDLTADERRRLDTHLDVCDQCRATLAAFSEERRMVAGLRHVAPPRDLGARVRAGIEYAAVPWWRKPAMIFTAVGGSLAAVAGALLAVSYLLPWLAELEIDRAAETWRADPDGAFRRLERAEELNPLAARPALTAGTIALRVGRVEKARQEFAKALEREPRNVYALLELGAIAAVEGDRRTALRLIRRANSLSPRDEDLRDALRRLEENRPLALSGLNERILERARSRGSQVD
jgi:tetratricopeptide (TPR) repeat protein